MSRTCWCSPVPGHRNTRYTTGMGASMNSRLASSGERRQVRGGKAGWARRPVGSQEGPVRCAGGRPSPTSGTPSGAGRFGAIGFWSHKGERREERQKSLPALRTSGGKAGRARGLGRAAGRPVGRGEEIALGRGEPWTPPSELAESGSLTQGSRQGARPVQVMAGRLSGISCQQSVEDQDRDHNE